MFVSYWQNQNALASSLHSVSCSILWAIETNFYTRRKFRAFCCHLDRNCPYPYVILFSTCETSNGPSRVIKPGERGFARVNDDNELKLSRTAVSRQKSSRTMLLALLFQVSWPERLTADQIMNRLPLYGDAKRPRAL